MGKLLVPNGCHITNWSLPSATHIRILPSGIVSDPLRITLGASCDLVVQHLLQGRRDRRVLLLRPRPPGPGLRFLRGRPSSRSASCRRPNAMVCGHSPVISETRRTPPRPRRLASTAANSRRCSQLRVARNAISSRWYFPSGWSIPCWHLGQRHRSGREAGISLSSVMTQGCWDPRTVSGPVRMGWPSRSSGTARSVAARASVTREGEDLLRISRGRRGITGPTARSRPVGLIGLRRPAGAMRPVGATGELQDHGAVDQAVEERRRQRRVAEVIGPRPEVDVRRQRRRTTARAGVEQAVVERAGLRLRLALQPVEAELVDQQQVESRSSRRASARRSRRPGPR